VDEKMEGIMKKIYQLQANLLDCGTWWDMGNFNDKAEANEAMKRKEKVETSKGRPNYVFRVIEIDVEE